ncbi:MAG: late competence development ComFB family protein [Treponema sp.]|jgi:competence protein ComFB|nr:late competence development ComFB family protein [Treponema sp.]
MDLHNIIEEIVIQKVDEFFDGLEKKDNVENFCTCNHCRNNTACYVLNRTKPFYTVSNRGVTRALLQQESTEQVQKDADIAILIYEGMKHINHNQRPNDSHSNQTPIDELVSSKAIFNIPTIMGRLFSGENFAPISDVQIELLRDNALVPMKDSNWQNPYNLVINTEGSYTFWPTPLPADSAEEHKVFEYSVRIENPKFDTLYHIFKIPVRSEYREANSFSLGRTFKLPDLFMFPREQVEQNRYLV